MISIIVPVYNCEKYLTGCLDSILTQSFSDFEIICIDDGSTDGSGIILDEAARKDARIKVWHMTNHGQAYARNYGIEQSQGKFVCFIDSDDKIHEQYLSNMIEAAEKNHSDLVVCGMNRVFVKKPSLLEKLFAYYPVMEKHDVLSVSQCPELLISMINAPYCKLIKKSFLEDHQIRFLEGKIYEDFFFTQSLLMNHPIISILEEQLYDYHVYQGSTMTNKKSKVHDMYDVMDALIEKYNHSSQFEEFKDELEYLCLHHICIGTVYRAFLQHPLSFFSELKRARVYLKRYHFSSRNPYVDKKQWFVKAYLKILFYD